MARHQRTESPDSLHPTAQLLIETTVDLLDSMPIEKVSLAAVLERAGISHGPLYHHFEDFSDLIEHAVVQRYVRNLKLSLDGVRPILDAQNPDDFRTRAEALFVQSTDPARRANRMERIEILGALKSHPRLVESIQRAQLDITTEQAVILQTAQDRGWIRADIDAFVQSGLIQALIIGRIIDDVAGNPTDKDAWSQAALLLFRTLLFDD